MSEGFIVKPLKCNHCGEQLPTMGQLVTFQCRTCFNYWILSPDGLKPITVSCAIPQTEFEGESVLLPFWVVEVDSVEFRKRMEEVVAELKDTTRTILSTNLQLDDSEMERLVHENPETDIGLLRTSMITEASKTKKVPTSGEVIYLFNRIEGSDYFLVYVPAFLSHNTYAYLKVGRLFTRRQPSYGIEKSGGLGHTVLCALQENEAVSLMDFIFFATLPDSIQANGDFLEKIHLEPASSPRLIEFPFENRGASLLSLIGNFSISSRLVDGLPKPKQPAVGSPKA